MTIWQTIREAFGAEFGRRSKTSARPNPWPRCPYCLTRVPALCADAEEGALPCGHGLACGCCTGPHLAPKRLS